MPILERAGFVRRALLLGALGLVALLGVTGTGLAVPPPPPNPSDQELEASREAADTKAGEVGTLTSRLAQAESRLRQAHAEVELRMEQANKARVDLANARAAADAAERDAASARAEADRAAAAIVRAREDLDQFISGSYQQGSTIGSVSAYLGAKNPRDLLARAQLLEAVSGSSLDALDGMNRARIEKSNKDAAARKALEIAKERRAQATQAKIAADDAQAQAIEARQAQASRTGAIEAEKERVQQLLFAAQERVDGLEGQRARYEAWQAEKERAEAERAQRAAASAGGGSGPAPVSGSVENAVARAMSQLGVQYAWGGGNASGPTYGIRDGGYADAHGDYMKIGFDCSGLMIYAFAGVKALPHYSGYQYESGTKVPLSQMRRGDMLFWGNGGIHHVAMYLGNGQMIEAPYSGSYVRVVPVRYDDILPYATRLIA